MVEASRLTDVALVAEYPWRYGGSQRLLHILARAWAKPIYLLPPAPPGSLVWNTPATIAVPDEPVLLSIVVDGFRPRLVPGRKHLKFCHSRSTIDRYWRDPRLTAVEFLTHRPRVHDHYRRRGLSITCVPNGYIPYDGGHVVDPAEQEAVCCVTSRLSPDKVPLALVAALGELPYPTYLVGSQEDRKHASAVRTAIGGSSRVEVVEPDQGGGGVSEQRQATYLRRSKILVHYATGGLKDHLEYSLLDALAAGVVPVCVTPDPAQFDVIEAEGLGRVVTSLERLPAAVDEALDGHEAHRAAAAGFMAAFASGQPTMLRRWWRTIDTLVDTMTT